MIFTQLAEAVGREVYIRTVSAMPRSLLPLLALSILAAPTLVVAPLSAAGPEPTASEISVARRLFDEGKAAEEAGRFREAAEKFRKAIAIKDTPGIRFHLARCEEEQGAPVEALVEYDRAQELIDGGFKAADVERLLPEARARVQAKVASLTLRLPEGASDAVVELDGKPISGSVLGGPIPVNPGNHRLRAMASGREPFLADVVLGVGEAKQLAIELPSSPQRDVAPLSASPAPALDSSSTRATERGASDTLRTVALVGEAALFAAGLSTGIVYTVAKSRARTRYDDANDLILAQIGGADPDGRACSMPLDGCSELEAARQSEQRSGTLATVGFVGAGVSALAFGLTLALWKTEPPARIQAGLGPGRASLVLSTRF
jgi:tetratricopeptide (TPR) repeat protein